MGDTHARVSDRDLDPVPEPARADRHAASLRSELDRVRDEVQDHLPQLACIDDKLQSTFRLGFDHDPLFLGQWIDGRPNLTNAVGNQSGLQAKLHLPRLDFRKVEDVVDQLEQVIAAVVNLIQEAAAGGGIVEPLHIVAEQL